MNIKRLFRAPIVAAALAAAAVSAPATDAAACGGAWIDFEMLLEQRDHGIDRAEAQFDKGDYENAAATVIRVMPHIKKLQAKSSPVVRRAMRILAVSTARMDGQLKIGDQLPSWVADKAQWQGKKTAHRDANLEWAVSALRDIDGFKKDDPTAQTELAEALAKTDAGKAEAKKMLEKLAKKDLITSGEGYAALAELRGNAGDRAGSKVAMDRCRKMVNESGVCGVTAKS